MAKKKTPEIDVSKLAIGRHTGDHIWGYEVFGDGRIQLSPGFADRFRRTMDREAGLRAMLEGVSRFVADELTRTAAERREWWNELADDTGLDIKQAFVFEGRTGSIIPPAPESPQESARPTDG